VHTIKVPQGCTRAASMRLELGCNLTSGACHLTEGNGVEAHFVTASDVPTWERRATTRTDVRASVDEDYDSRPRFIGFGPDVKSVTTKNLFQVHGVGEHGKQKQLRRPQVLEFFVSLPAGLIAREARGSAHYRARKLQGCGHPARLVSPQFAKP
jgi:hypothetical protein